MHCTFLTILICECKSVVSRSSIYSIDSSVKIDTVTVLQYREVCILACSFIHYSSDRKELTLQLQNQKKKDYCFVVP